MLLRRSRGGKRWTSSPRGTVSARDARENGRCVPRCNAKSDRRRRGEDTDRCLEEAWHEKSKEHTRRLAACRHGDALSRGARPCAIPGLSYCYLHLVTIPAGGVWVMGCVLKRSLCLVSLGVLCFACGGCASPGPATPSFAAMPGRGKSYEAFQETISTVSLQLSRRLGTNPLARRPIKQRSYRCRWHGPWRRCGCRNRFGVGNMGMGAGLGAGTGLGCR